MNSDWQDINYFLMTWTVLTFVGIGLFKYFQKKFILLISPLVGVFYSGNIFFHYTAEDANNKIGIFFLLFLCTMHLLFSMMLDAYSTKTKTKLVGASSMVLTGWAYFVANPWTFAALWGLTVIPHILYFAKESQHAKRIYAFHHLISLICIVMAFFLLSIQGEKGWSLANTRELGMLYSGHAVVVLLIIAAFIRQGIFPFHLWFKASYKTKPFPLNIGFYVGNLGFFVFLQVVIPILENGHADLFPYVMIWGIVSGLYFACMSLVQERVRSTVFYVMLAQFSTLFCGLDVDSATGKAGVLFQFLSLGLSFGGLMACLYVMEWHLGELKSKRFHGLQGRNPALSLYFLLFSLCAVALPFTMGFAGEDLIFHAVVEKYPITGLGIILTAAINGISLFRITTFLFRGERSDVRDDKIFFGFWQKFALGFLLALLLGFGMAPNALIPRILIFI